MNVKNRRFLVVDILLLLGALLPLAAIMVLKILTAPPTEGIEITGALVYFTIPMPLQDLPITEAQVNSWAVMITILFLCLYLTHGISAKGGLKRQLLAEWIVEKCDGMVRTNMGDYFMGFAPFIAGMLGLSALSSLSSLLGLFPPTSDMNIVAGWAILVFILITYYKCKAGPLHYLKSFAEPVPFLLPMNLINFNEIKIVDKSLCICCNLEHPLALFASYDFAAASFTNAVYNFFVCENALTACTPVNSHLGLVSKTLLEELEENPLSPLVVAFVCCVDFS